jgi:hypothetical protein
LTSGSGLIYGGGGKNSAAVPTTVYTSKSIVSMNGTHSAAALNGFSSNNINKDQPTVLTNVYLR